MAERVTEWRAELDALRAELRAASAAYETALANERHEREKLAEQLAHERGRADRLEAFADAMERQVRAWQQLDERKSAQIAEMRAEIDVLKRQVAEVPTWRERVQKAELLVALWRRYADILADLLRVSGQSVPPPPPEMGEVSA